MWIIIKHLNFNYMNRIPKYKAKYLIPHQNNLKIAEKDSIKEHLVPKITQRNWKFSDNRNFGKDISNSLKNNGPNCNSNHSKKNSTDMDKKINKIYILKSIPLLPSFSKNAKNKNFNKW